ncbi:hypothetical protein Q5424_01215 [Conexibacter sp. JD483]|uniref:hypothetical protein n=1 Tax=unclassified Conexibacter TaxID=2627773 RepID=UPI002727749C|nr:MULTISPECIES: hypothetical protein [unclassified Conexibacter]MDO8185848.1 hypothetical protein [Conexibacter sp. CPCC 205706]MDO8198592.1 hypothetical protein [Conexibacter sp. CPCC 205762]MDR9367678.1 hypothetical protein [Conexibacter sp. JD483]
MSLSTVPTARNDMALTGPSEPAASYVDHDGRTCHVFVEKYRRTWVIAVGYTVEELPDSPDACRAAIGIARDYAATHHRSQTGSA